MLQVGLSYRNYVCMLWDSKSEHLDNLLSCLYVQNIFQIFGYLYSNIFIIEAIPSCMYIFQLFVGITVFLSKHFLLLVISFSFFTFLKYIIRYMRENR
jgi:hypothetical protein